MAEFLLNIDLVHLIMAAGYVGLFFVIFAESGLFFGFFLPGDSLLFTAGLLAVEGYFTIWILVPLLVFAAIAGDSVGYWFGKRVGPALFAREDSFLLRRRHAERARVFFEKHGAYAIVMARFLPIVRTFTPIIAGIALMPYRTFLTYNIFGGAGWVALFVLMGYFLGLTVPDIEHYLLPISIGIVLLSLIPILRELRRSN
jgi:membrane-associated protein